MKKTFWIVLTVGVLSVFFTDLSSDSGFFAVFLPIIDILCAILLVVIGFGLLFQREHEIDYQTHVSVDKKEIPMANNQIPKNAKAVNQTITNEKKTVSTRTLKYIDGKKIQDSYEKKSS